MVDRPAGNGVSLTVDFNRQYHICTIRPVLSLVTCYLCGGERARVVFFCVDGSTSNGGPSFFFYMYLFYVRIIYHFV